MEMDQFDAITRRLGSAGSSRRQALRVLGGALIGGVAARLGLTEPVEATRARQRKRRKSREERKEQADVQAEGKGKGKKQPPFGSI